MGVSRASYGAYWNRTLALQLRCLDIANCEVPTMASAATDQRALSRIVPMNFLAYAAMMVDYSGVRSYAVVLVAQSRLK